MHPNPMHPNSCSRTSPNANFSRVQDDNAKIRHDQVNKKDTSSRVTNTEMRKISAPLLDPHVKNKKSPLVSTKSSPVVPKTAGESSNDFKNPDKTAC